MYSMVIILNNTVLYLKVAKKIDCKCSYHKKEMVIMRPDGGVSKRYGGNLFTICKYIISTHCTRKTDSVTHQLNLSKTGEKKELSNPLCLLVGF